MGSCKGCSETEQGIKNPTEQFSGQLLEKSISLQSLQGKICSSASDVCVLGAEQSSWTSPSDKAVWKGVKFPT